MSDSAIPMSFRPAQIQEPDIVGGIQRGMNLQQMAQATQLNQARIKEEQIKAQNAAEDRDDEATFQQGYLDAGGDWDKMRASVAPKVRLRNLQRADADHLTQQRAVLAMTSDKRQQLDLENKLVGQEAAGLLQLPYEQRQSAAPAALARLQKAGVDTSQYQNVDPTDDALKAMAAHSNYLGAVLSYADKQAQEEQRKATAKRQEAMAARTDQQEQQAAKQQKMEDAARAHLGVTTQDQHDEWLKSLDPDIAPLYKNLKGFDENTQNVIQRMGMNSQGRAAADTRDQAVEDRRNANEQRNQIQQDALQFRKDAQEQNAALREMAINMGALRSGKGGVMTPAERGREERNIAALEDGTPKQPGLNQRREMIGTVLANGKETVKGNEVDLTSSRRAELEAEYRATSNSLQNTQYRKAGLYGIQPPNQEDVAAAPNDSELAAPDGSTWKKSGGVAFFKSAGQGASPTRPTAAPVASPATPARGPAAAAPAAPPKTALPDAIMKQLKSDKVTKLSDGTAWALVNGQPTKMQKNGNNWEPAKP